VEEPLSATMLLPIWSVLRSKINLPALPNALGMDLEEIMKHSSMVDSVTGLNQKALNQIHAST
jgi:hypothetical protein